ncbi:MAG: SLBB domain-containing protein [Chitinophagaceae bacterium]|nr:SLBB domain-containing protein [Chitinophagaceae bacterium]
MNLYSIKKLAYRIVFAGILLAAVEAGAQVGTMGLPGTKVSQMSDPQILQLWQQAQRSGLSENETMSLLVKRGLPSSEVNNFKRRLLSLQSRSKSGGEQKLVSDSANFIRDSSWITEIPQLKRKSTYYGFDFFNNPTATFEPNLRLTTPKTYVLGPDDQLTINYTGVNEASAEATVSADGTIQIPYAGVINVNGLTLDQATEKIKSRMRLAYPAIASGRTQVFITLNNFKTIRVTIVGEAERPGMYYVSSLATLFNVLYKANGPSENGSLRKIELIRNNQVIETVDFYAFLQKGLLGRDIRLEDQDIIRFPLFTKRVSLAGQVRRPAVYELLEKETLADLLQLGGGLQTDAIADVAKVVQMGNRDMHMRDIAAADFSYFIPRNGDSVFFDRILSRFSNRVVLSGAVYRPGSYELTDNLSLARLIKKADGLKEDAYDRGYIKRRDGGAQRSLITFNSFDILGGRQADIPLLKDDSVFVLSKDSLVDVPTITVGGNVRMPGNFQYREGMTVEDAVLMAGGFTLDAASHKIEISRLEKNRADTLANKLVDLITVDVDSSLTGPGSKTLLRPLDIIFVPRLLNYRTLGSVKIRGEVLYAGDYALERRDETVQEVIARSGGISPFASLSDVQVFRKGVRVATNLLEPGGGRKERFLLLPDDSIFIPRRDPFVEVQGFVFNPQILSYSSDNFLSYISDVGGVTEKGNLKKAYVQYSNGISRKIRHFLFFRSYPRVLPGSKIIVPEKVDTGRHGLSVVEISALVSAMAALVGIINVLK